MALMVTRFFVKTTLKRWVKNIMNDHLNKILWLWVPLIFLATQTIIEIFASHEIRGALHSENGPHESLQFLCALGALIIALRCLFTTSPTDKPYLFGWITCFVLGCAYIAGEEVSWGQHIFEWATPEFWSGVNDQGETNLHNTTSWLDQKPRLLLLIGVVTGGILIPLLKRFKPSALPKKFEIIYPPAILGLTATLAISANLIDKVSEFFNDVPILSRGSEVEELYLFYFVLLYLMILRRRLAQH